MSEVFKGGPIDIGGTLLHQVTQTRLSPTIERYLNMGGGSNTIFAGVTGVRPVASFDTPAIATALGLVPLFASVATVKIYRTKLVHGGLIAAGSVHGMFTLNRTIIVLRSITARQGQAASATFDILAAYDGSNNPVTFAADQAVPAFTGGVEAFTVGVARSDVLGAPAFPENAETQSLDITPNISDEAIADSGSAFAEDIILRSMQPEVRMMTFDAGVVTDAVINGVDDANIDFFLRKLKDKSIPHADVDTEHLKISMGDALVSLDESSGAEDGVAETTLVWNAVDDGSNPYFAIAASQAIPA